MTVCWKWTKRAKALAKWCNPMIIIVCHIIAQLETCSIKLLFAFAHNVNVIFTMRWLFQRCLPSLLCSLAELASSFYSRNHQHGYTRTDDHNLWLTIVIALYLSLNGHCYHLAELLYSSLLLWTRSSFVRFAEGLMLVVVWRKLW